MSEDYDRKTGRWSTDPSPGVLPRYAVSVEEQKQTWKSRDPQWQDDLPESPPYDRVAGNNIIHKDVAYKMVHTGNRWVKEHFGDTWGEIKIKGDTDVTIPADTEQELESFSGYGWLYGFYARISDDLLRFHLRKDKKRWLQYLTASAIREEGFFDTDWRPRLTRDDNHNEQYDILFDPPSPMPFNGALRLVTENIYGHEMTIDEYEINVMIN